VSGGLIIARRAADGPLHRPLPAGDVGDGDVPLLLAESPPHAAMTNPRVAAAAPNADVFARASMTVVSPDKDQNSSRIPPPI
jgi:hypothetical protein